MNKDLLSTVNDSIYLVKLDNHVIVIQHITNIVMSNEKVFIIYLVHSDSGLRFTFETKEECEKVHDMIVNKIVKTQSKLVYGR